MATEAGHDPRTQPVPPKLLIGGGLLVAAIVFLVVTSLQSNAVYYVTASELLARGSAASGQTVRLAGAVVDGSIQHDRAHRGVVVGGRLGADGVLEARNISVKHGPALEAAHTGTSR